MSMSLSHKYVMLDAKLNIIVMETASPHVQGNKLDFSKLADGLYTHTMSPSGTTLALLWPQL